LEISAHIKTCSGRSKTLQSHKWKQDSSMRVLCSAYVAWLVCWLDSPVWISTGACMYGRKLLCCCCDRLIAHPWRHALFQ
jgi:hypothetical protein